MARKIPRGIHLCGGALLTLLAQPALAQSENDSPAVEDIVVTAQKRAERMQDVPVTITAVSALTAAAQGIASPTDLTAIVPGLQINQQIGGAAPFIRGVGNLDSSPGDEASTAIFVDGVYMAARNGNLFQFNNIDRIEVLKGPQGTLFGRNANGGVINIITKDPSQMPAFAGEIGYGNYATFSGNAYATAGLSQNAAIDLAGYYSHQAHGWGRNLATGEDVNKSEEYGIRSKLLIDVGDRTTIKVAGDYGHSLSDIGIALQTPPGSVSLVGTTYPGKYNTNSDSPQFARTTAWGASLTVTHEADWARLTSITAYRDSRATVDIDPDASPFFLFFADGDKLITKTTTQELQIASPSDARISWIVGIYMLFQRAGYDTLDLTGLALAPAISLSRYSFQRTESYAGYGQATIPLGARTNVTLGLRYTIDDRHLKARDSIDVGLPAPIAAPYPDVHKTFSKLTYKAAIDHKITDGVMVYGQYSRGFKSGLFNTVQPADPPVRPEVLDAFEIGLKSELFDRRIRLNIAGFYYDFKDIQLFRTQGAGLISLFNAAKSRMKGVDADLNAAVTGNFSIQAGLSYLDAKYRRGEGSVFAVNPNGGNTPLPPGDPGNDLSGNRMIFAPKWQANFGGQYKVDTGFGSLLASALYTYNDGYFFTAANRTRQGSYDVVNASLAWTSTDERFGLKLWGKNLTGAYYYVYGDEQTFSDLGAPGAPRTYGVTLSVKLK